MAVVVEHPDECIGCGACVDSCPTGVLELVDNVVAATALDGCVSCGACADSCPMGTILEIE